MKTRLQNDVKEAMKAKERDKVTTLRAILAEIQEAQLQKRGEELTDNEYLTILNRMVNQRRESIDQFKKAERTDLVEKEEAQLQYILPYLPEPLTEAEIVAIVDAAIAELGVDDISGMGKLMNAIRPHLLGRADMSAVSGIVKARLVG